MNLQAALASGKDGMLFTIVSVSTVMILGFVVGKLFKVDYKTSYLVSSGTAICGGSAIHDTSSVVAAAAAYSDESLQVAAMVKCTSALWILPLALVTMFFRKYGGKGKLNVIPWFIFLFATAMVVNTYLFPLIGVPESIGSTIVLIAKRGFAVTLFLIGTGLTPKALKSCGVRPFIQGVFLWFAIGIGSPLVIM